MVCDCGVTVVDWATFAAALGTMVLAGVALYQAKQAKSQINLGKAQLAAAQEASQAAVEVHHESIRARVDQFAPRVSVHFGAVGGPYYSPGTLDLAQRIVALDAENLDSASGMEFVLPRDGGSYLWFYGRALIVNDGNMTARVRLPGQARFIAGHSAIAGKNVDLPVFRETSVVDEAILAPGQHALFQWSDGKEVSGWATSAEDPGGQLPGGSVWLWTTVFDTRADGTIDTLMGHFKPELLTAVQGSTGVWRVTDSRAGEMVSLPARRGYRSEGAFAADLSQMYEYHGVDAQGRSTKEPQQDTD